MGDGGDTTKVGILGEKSQVRWLGQVQKPDWGLFFGLLSLAPCTVPGCPGSEQGGFPN